MLPLASYLGFFFSRGILQRQGYGISDLHWSYCQSTADTPTQLIYSYHWKLWLQKRQNKIILCFETKITNKHDKNVTMKNFSEVFIIFVHTYFFKLCASLLAWIHERCFSTFCVLPHIVLVVVLMAVSRILFKFYCTYWMQALKSRRHKKFINLQSHRTTQKNKHISHLSPSYF